MRKKYAISKKVKYMDYVIIEKLKELRKSKKITQEQLAEKLDISRSKISSWETNKREMSIAEAVKLAKIYEISLDSLFEVNTITKEEYISISDKFLKCKDISLEDKVRIIELLRDTLKKNNINEFYENYKMTQNATK